MSKYFAVKVLSPKSDLQPFTDSPPSRSCRPDRTAIPLPSFFLRSPLLLLSHCRNYFPSGFVDVYVYVTEGDVGDASPRVGIGCIQSLNVDEDNCYEDLRGLEGSASNDRPNQQHPLPLSSWWRLRKYTETSVASINAKGSSETAPNGLVPPSQVDNDVRNLALAGIQWP